MLARIWDAPEATSIWVEIVKRRKEEVIADFDGTDIAHLATLSAAQQDLPRAQIAEWDDSARAWLRVADGVKKKQQKQLMLILDNVQLPVNWKTTTYESVMEAWSNALTQMEALVQGISQQARSGDILLAVSSWHLFPDLTVVTPSITHVHQHDPAFGSGGLLTIGLQTPMVQESGVHWSLPLAHLRHYGAPVKSTRSICNGLGERLSLPDLLQATLGSLLQSWGAAGKETSRSLRWLSSMYRLLLEEAKLGNHEASLLTGGVAERSWLALLSEAANLYMNSEGIERQHNNKLISLGRKHGKTFLGTPAAPCFGLLEHGSFVNIVASEEERIDLLREVGRRVAEQMRLQSPQMFIRYKHRLSESSWVYEYASAIPYITGWKRKADDTSCSIQSHHRWLYSGGCARLGEANHEYYERYRQETGNSTQEIEDAYARSGDTYRSASGSADTMTPLENNCNYVRREAVLQAAGEHVSRREEQNIEDLFPGEVGIHWWRAGSPLPYYNFTYGSINDAALFVATTKKPYIETIQTSEMNAALLYSMFEGHEVDKLTIAQELDDKLRFARTDVDPHLKSLKGISTAAMMFRYFQNASVDVRILERGLYSASWIRSCIAPEEHQEVQHLHPISSATPFSLSSYAFSKPGTILENKPLWSLRGTPAALMPYVLSEPQAFACLAMFESGRYDIDPGQLVNVMAMSSGDSIYVSAALLTDPYDNTQPGDIRGFIGNIGRPGITFLVPPKNPMIKEVSINEWPLIERNEFDGCLSDHFQSTSLHLSFTTAETPLNLGFSGGQDLEASILETLFSVYERGSWIADLNVTNVTEPTSRLFKLERCTTQHPVCTQRSNITCIDSWLGLVDAPEEKVSLVRACGNWQARLAASSISLALGYHTILLPDDVCLQCFNHAVHDEGFRENLVAIG
ncbi:MAG: hypothetical protein Q9168_002602 [Polycauliona sp. 1 TL-2023]